MMKQNRALLFLSVLLCGALTAISIFAQTKTPLSRNMTGKYVVAAYYRPGYGELPDPKLVTHIFSSQGQIAPSHDALSIKDTLALRQLQQLKKENRDLKIVLSIGGYHVDGWSDMTYSDSLRRSFVKSCRAAIDKYDLDGIDLDWEFPTTTAGGLKARPEDDKNYTKLAKELRESIGSDKIITFYSNNSGKWIDFDGMLPYVDYVMVSGYNLGCPPKSHQSNLYPSAVCGNWSISKSIDRHIELGVPPAKIMLGIPFYARFTPDEKNLSYADRPDFDKYFPDVTEKWDAQAKVPYAVNGNGEMTAAYDNPRSIKEKARYIKSKGLAGAFYWHYSSDDLKHTMSKSVNSQP